MGATLTIISAILSSTVISTIINFYVNLNNNKIKYVSYERTKTYVSKRLRKLIPKIFECKNRNQLLKIIPEIQGCINPYYFSEALTNNNYKIDKEDIKHDVLIWDILFKIEDKNYCKNMSIFNELKIKLGLYISCWLKFDWDRYHHEVNKKDKNDYEPKFVEAAKKIFRASYKTIHKLSTNDFKDDC